ncbi:hypothetical protein BJX96DRAFT_162990 [Aspergillus floccosus]
MNSSPALGTIVMNLEEVSVPRRNVHLFDGQGKYLAGMRIRTDDRYVTNSNLYFMSAIVLDLDDGGSSSPQWAIYRLAKSGRTHDTWSVREMLPRDNRYVDVGNYAVLTTNASYLRVESTWNATPQIHGWITDHSPATEIGTSRLFSPQNGILMGSHLHEKFDLCKFSINPDDGYKITYFDQDLNALDPANPQHRVSDGLLRWHFRQAALKNMKRVQDVWPDWEFDLAGGNLLEIIRRGPNAEERMELELFARLAGCE